MKCAKCSGNYEFEGRTRKRHLCVCCMYLVDREEDRVRQKKTEDKFLAESGRDEKISEELEKKTCNEIVLLSNCCNFYFERVRVPVDGVTRVLYLCEKCWKLCTLVKFINTNNINTMKD